VNSVRLNAGGANDESAAYAALSLRKANRSLAGSDYFAAGAGVVVVVGLAVFLDLVDFAFAVDLAAAGVVVGAVVAWAKSVLIARMEVAIVILIFIVFL